MGSWYKTPYLGMVEKDEEAPVHKPGSLLKLLRRGKVVLA
jgi:hypothetical protein